MKRSILNLFIGKISQVYITLKERIPQFIFKLNLANFIGLLPGASKYLLTLKEILSLGKIEVSLNNAFKDVKKEFKCRMLSRV